MLVGGSSRIPKIREIVAEFFDGADLCHDVDADEGVAIGAAMMAGILAGQTAEDVTLTVSDVVPQNLGLELAGDEFDPIIKAGTTFPIEKEGGEYQTTRDDCETMKFWVRTGPSMKASENVLVEKCVFGGIPKGPAGSQYVTPIFTVDANSILKVSARITKADGTVE